MTEAAAPAAPVAAPAAPTSDADFVASLKAEFAPEPDADMSEVDFVWPGEEPKVKPVEAEAAPVVETPAVEAPKPAELNELTSIKQKLQAKEAAELAAKKRGDTLEAQLKERDERLAAFEKMDVHSYLAQRGTSLREVLTKISKGEMELPDAAPKAELPKDVQDMLAEHKSTKERLAKEAQAKAFEAARKSDVEAVTEMVGASEHQLLKALPGGADQVVNAFYEAMQGKAPEQASEVLAEVVARSEKNLRDSVVALLGNESVVAWIGSQPELYAKVTRTASPAVQQTPPIPGKPAQGTPVVAAPTTLTPSMGSQVPARSDRKGHVDPAELAAEFNRDMAAGKFA